MPVGFAEGGGGKEDHEFEDNLGYTFKRKMGWVSFPHGYYIDGYSCVYGY